MERLLHDLENYCSVFELSDDKESIESSTKWPTCHERHSLLCIFASQWWYIAWFDYFFLGNNVYKFFLFIKYSDLISIF